MRERSGSPTCQPPMPPSNRICGEEIFTKSSREI